MEISFDHSFAGLLVLLSVLVAAAISYFLYFKNTEHQSLTKAQKIALALLRFISLVLIFLFLLSPVIERSKKLKERPILAIAFDNSKSVENFKTSFQDLSQKLKNEFDGDYQLDFWTFGEKVENNDQLNFNGRRSDYGQLLKSMRSFYLNKNIGALILSGDGIYNQGQNPMNIGPSLKFPVYTIGIGDTSRQTDALIKNVKTNKTAYLKNKFPVEIELKFIKLKEQLAHVEIENNGEKVYSGNLSIGSDDYFKVELVNLEARKIGMQHYKIRITPFEGESNLQNNVYEFVIQVLENKQRILLLSDGPHPDMGAIRSSLLSLQNYDIKLVTGNDLPDSLSSYNLIVLNQIPSVKNAASKLMAKILGTRIPVLFILGPNSQTEQLNSLDMGLQITASPNTEEIQPRFNEDFSLFVLSPETKQAIESMPPLIAPFGNTELRATLQNLANQSIKNITTPKVLMALGINKGRKTGFIMGEGIWRWRLADFEATKTHEAFDELIQKIVQYLALHENEDNFNIYYSSLFQESDPVEFTAELYNDSYELVNAPDVNIKIKNSSQQEFSYIFDRTSDHYKLNAGNFEPGDYSFEAETKLGNQQYTEKGNFSVVKNDQETQNTVADFGLLYQLSQATGGQFFTPENYGTLVDAIKQNKQITVQQHKQILNEEWINLKLLFFILIVLLGTEWFFRKYWGIY